MIATVCCQRSFEGALEATFEKAEKSLKITKKDLTTDPSASII